MQENLPHSQDYRWHTVCQFTNERKNETNKQIKSRKKETNFCTLQRNEHETNRAIDTIEQFFVIIDRQFPSY